VYVLIYAENDQTCAKYKATILSITNITANRPLGRDNLSPPSNQTKHKKHSYYTYISTISFINYNLRVPKFIRDLYNLMRPM